MSRISLDIDTILSEIQGSPDGVGFDVSFTKVYDDVKEARFEEDHTVSRGVWERELKKADWSQVEKLAYVALSEKSKDFQILGWLIEALVTLDGFGGIASGVKILSGFVRAFWRLGYPKTEDMESDEEQKFRILEWIYDSIARLSKFIPFISIEDSKVDICQYDRAIDLRNTLSKAALSASKILDRAQKDGVKTIEDIGNIINHASSGVIAELNGVISEIIDAVTEFKNVMSAVSGRDASGAFYGLLENLKKIENVVSRRTHDEDGKTRGSIQLIDVTPCQIDCDSRDAIYDRIDDIAKRLAVIERHSPSSYILSLVVSWKHKNLLEIMDDLKSGSTESHRLLKSLIS